jgi:hypothetical protein
VRPDGHYGLIWTMRFDFHHGMFATINFDPASSSLEAGLTAHPMKLWAKVRSHGTEPGTQLEILSADLSLAGQPVRWLSTAPPMASPVHVAIQLESAAVGLVCP